VRITALAAFGHSQLDAPAACATASVLVVASQLDDRTPMSWARSMARTPGMESSLIRYEGGTHSTYFTPGRFGPRIACIDSAVEAYLFDLRCRPKGLPALRGLSCSRASWPWRGPQGSCHAVKGD
jgi:hypothetical protein